ncbi:MAG TPA: hypothetical protein PLM73_00520 [Petrotogaceae bacterium]|nr:hypothetical protein [Petrotogaceae bacterium]HOT30921.1 hypothetical protein [Petrotogaceae bacterium]HPA92972.1 hypothetical protein [Petrotogaceae bacterium]HQF32168.1 hypothetical protein [Petrotogaceae bacterium]HQH33090.1 hypothetical protein [Petrotogaceae bacterium]
MAIAVTCADNPMNEIRSIGFIIYFNKDIYCWLSLHTWNRGASNMAYTEYILLGNMFLKIFFFFFKKLFPFRIIIRNYYWEKLSEFLC